MYEGNYGNLEAVSRTLRVYGRLFKILGAVLAGGGLILFLVGLAAHYQEMETRMQELTGVLAFLAGAGLHGVGVIIAASGEALLAFNDSVRSQKETATNSAEMVRLLTVATK